MQIDFTEPLDRRVIFINYRLTDLRVTWKCLTKVMCWRAAATIRQASKIALQPQPLMLLSGLYMFPTVSALLSPVGIRAAFFRFGFSAP